MNRIRRALIAVSVLSVLFVTGCSSTGYLANRRRDAADILTLTVGAGDGVKVRVGPLQVAAIRNADLAGLRAGEFFADGDGLILNEETYAPIPLFTVWSREATRGARLRRALATGRPLENPEETDPSGPAHGLDRRWITRRDRWSRLFGEEVFSHGLHSVSERRGKNVMAKSPTPVTTFGATPAFYSQVEVAAGLLFTVRVGVNPGEFVDFVLGWFGVDMYGDDL